MTGSGKAVKATVTLMPPRENTAEAKIERTADFCRRAATVSVNAILDSGKRLAALKAEIGDGWLAAFGENRKRQPTGHNPFPFGSSTADKMIRIHERFSSAVITDHGALPPSWNTLYELSKLDDKALIENKDKIRPDMTRAQARALVEKPKAKKEAKPKEPEKTDAIEAAYAEYMKLPKSQFLTEIVALIQDKGVTLDEVKSAWGRMQ